MSDLTPEHNDAPLTPEELHAARFAQMVMQLASTALVLLGRIPNPTTGKTETDLDAARLFIDQLEMLEVKTKGNLDSNEQHLLKQNLMTVRMAFVQAVEAPPDTSNKAASAPDPEDKSSADPDEASKKKFTKNYGSP